MNLDHQCEKFMGGPAVSYNDRVHVTISKEGKIHLNRKAHSMMNEPQAVYLYFNRPKDMIIIEPTSAVTSNAAFPLKEYDKSYGGRIIHANPFCKHFGIRPELSRKFISPEVDDAGRMYLKLYETISVSGPPRKRKKQQASL